MLQAIVDRVPPVGQEVLQAIVILADSAFQFTGFMRFKPIKIFPPPTLWNASAFIRTEFPQFKPNQADRIRHKTASATIPHLILYQHCHKTIPYHTRQYCAISNHTRQYHIMSQHTKHTVPNHTKDIIQHLVPFQHCHKTIPNSLRQKFLSPLCGHIS